MKRISVSLPGVPRKKFVQMASREGASVSAFARRVLINFVNSNYKPAPPLGSVPSSGLPGSLWANARLDKKPLRFNKR